jgi:hypothetical protein
MKARLEGGAVFHVQKMLAGAVAVGVLFAVTDASADVQACLAASEKGQRARAAGNLREAREQFVVCGAQSCPALVRRDCAEWTSQLAQTLPTLVFGAHDRQGHDLFDVTVSMDGEPLVTKLDGKSVMVDPGRHTFRFEMAGFPPVTQVVLVKEGERARGINVTFGGEGSTPAAMTPVKPTPPDNGRKEAKGGHTPYPWIVVGIGAVGVAVGAAIALTAPSFPPNCIESTRTCIRIGGQSDEEFRKVREDARTADVQPLLGYGVVAGGLALVASGLLWHFLERTGSAKGTRISPWTTGWSSGVTLGTPF